MPDSPAPTGHRAVFLSYASQDAEAARRLCEALRSGGVEVWFDQDGGLEHGDEWDAKIRRQIRECVLFIPFISATTQARLEGYFRIEWDLAAERAQAIAQGVPFILPVVIDDTREPDAFVPDRFRKVQWTRLPGGFVPPEVRARLLKLWSHRTGAQAHSAARAGTESVPPNVAPVSTDRSENPRRRWLIAGLIVAALALAAFWVGRRFGAVKSGELERTQQLAVLPFKNIGDTPNNQAFSDGLSETITALLSQLEQFQRTLHVVPMTEVRKETVMTAREARTVFGATLALTGSVQREESTVRVTVSLVDTKTLRIVRSATLDNASSESYRLQDRVAAETAGWLGLEISEQAKRILAAGQTNIAAAYELYLRGRGELARRDLPGSLDAAIVHLQQALLADPRYALAHAALGMGFWLKYGETKERLWAEEARRSCNSALEYGPLLAEPHITLAVLSNGTGQYEQAVLEAQTALRLDPANADATRALARAYARLNRPAEAEAALQRAIERNPKNAMANTELAVFYWLAGRYPEAERHFLRVTELMPDNYAVYRNLGGLYVMMGRPEEAARLLEKSLELKPSPSAYSNLGTLRFQQKRYAESANLFMQATRLSPREHLLLGNLADALRFVPDRAAEVLPAYKQAVRLAEEALLVNPKDPAVRASLARYCAYSGDTARALEEIGQARTLAPQNVPVMFGAALVFERAGQRPRALEALGLAIKGGYSKTDIELHPDLNELRAAPQFVSLMADPAGSSKK